MKTGHKASVILTAACLTVAVLSPVRANANLLDALFGERSELSGVLIDKLGSAVLKVLHPTNKHWLTKATRAGDSDVLFTTEYKGWLKSHMLTWRVKFNPSGSIDDIVIEEDSNPVDIGEKMLVLIKERVMKFVEEYRKERSSSR